MRQSYILCEQCDRELQRPIWIRVDHDDHRAHCRECTAERDRLFTPEAAIDQAIIVIADRQGALGVRR